MLIPTTTPFIHSLIYIILCDHLQFLSSYDPFNGNLEKNLKIDIAKRLKPYIVTMMRTFNYKAPPEILILSHKYLKHQFQLMTVFNNFVVEIS